MKMGGISKNGSSAFSLLLLSAAIILASIPIVTCGGGGGGGNGEDTTPPTVASTSPINGATEVETDALIKVTFSEAMDASTLTTSTFTVSTAGGGISGAVTCSGSTATFTPSAPLAYSTTFTATITSGAKDAAGNALASAYTWSFTTKASSQTRLYFSHTEADMQCAPVPEGARGGLCPTNPIPVDISVLNFIYQGSPADWVTTLADDLNGLGYGMTLQLASLTTTTGTAQIIIKKGAAETILFASPTFTVNSDEFKPFVYEGTGISAGGVPGDQLILRVTCLSGCSGGNILFAVLSSFDNNFTSFIDVPQTAVIGTTALKPFEAGPAHKYEYKLDASTGEPRYDPLTGELVSVTKYMSK
jgi:hypothetical protein